MNKILVTGGAGFLGSHLCRRILKYGLSYYGDENPTECQVICVDNLYTGSTKNIGDLMGNSNFKFIKGDITNSYWLKHNKEFEGVTHIFNCACPASPIHYQGKHAIETTMTSVVGMKNLLDLATKWDAKIMQFSTSEVYGDPDIGCPVQPEHYRGNVNCTGPRACYDEGKRCAESLCFDYNRIYKTKIKVIRIFNTYGPYMNKDDGRVISNFVCQALQNQDITVYGDGMQTRSFCYVDDLIEGIIKMMDSEDQVIGPVNLGNPTQFTMIDLARIILDLIPESTSKIVQKDLPQDDPRQRKPDIMLAKGILGWKPEVSLIKGLVYTIRYFRNILNKEEL